MAGTLRKRGTRRDGTTRWQARWRHPYQPHTRVERQFRTKVEAEAWLAKQDAEAFNGHLASPAQRAADVTWDEIIATWLDSSVNVHPGTRKRYERIARTYMVPMFRKRPAETTTADVQRWVNALAEDHNLAPGSIQNVFSAFRRACNVGVNADLLARNPTRGVRLPRVPRADRTILGPEEITRLAMAHDRHWRTLIYTAAYTGLRAGELMALRWSDLSLTPGDGRPSSLVVARSVREIGREFVVGLPKNGRTRTVALPPFLARRLSRLRRRVVGLGEGPDGLVFTTSRGYAWRQNGWYKREFKPAALRALPAKPNLRFHDLRHTHASMLISAGANPKAVADRLGHHSAAFTLTVYAHMFPATDAALAYQLNGLAVGRSRAA